MNKVYALIPARAGSKGIPMKNMIKLHGKPLIEWTISESKLSSRIDRIFVSSDNEEILQYAHTRDIETVLRPEEFSKDDTPASEVVQHFIDYLTQNEGSLNEEIYILYLQPTSPLRSVKDIDAAIDIISRKNVSSVLSVIKDKRSPFKSFILKSDHTLHSLFDEELTNARRQDLDQTYYPNGAIYLFKIKSFVENGAFPSNGAFPYIMEEESSVDIDDYSDLKKAEILLERHES